MGTLTSYFFEIIRETEEENFEIHSITTNMFPELQKIV